MTNTPGVAGPGIPATLSAASAGSAEPWWAPMTAGALEAVVELPGSKLLSARALLLAVIADALTTPTGLLRSRDTELMLAIPSVLNARFEDLDETGTRLRVMPVPLPLHVQTGPGGAGRIDVGLAGTVMCFVPALVALADASAAFDGDEAARHHPMAPLLDAPAALGAEVIHLGESGFLLFRVGPDDGTPLRTEGARVVVDSLVSSQFISALLFLDATLPGGLELTPTGPVPSLTHVGITVATSREWGIAVDEPAPGTGDDKRIWRVRPGRPRSGEVAIEPGLSSAGSFLAAALAAGGQVSVPHWPAATIQAGNAWCVLLPRLGGEVMLTDGLFTAHGTGRPTGIHADLSDVGELAPTVTALVALAGVQGHTSTLTDIARLRGHETDRLAALATQIHLLGGDAEESDDGLITCPTPPHGAVLRSYTDHRMAIFVTIIGLSVGGVSLDDVECTSKTLSGFTDPWAAMPAIAGEGGSGLATASYREPATPGDGT